MPQNYRTGLAITAVIVAVLALSLGDAVIKATGVSLPLWQMFILRSGLALPLLGLLLFNRGAGMPVSLLWISVRSTLLVVMWLCYYSALSRMPLSLAAAAYYTSPILITLIATIHARKSPTLTIWMAVALGFGGVVLILRPDVSEFQIVTLLPVVAAFLYASAMVLTSVKCCDEDPIALAVALNIAFVIGGLFLGLWSGREGSFIFGSWAPVNMKLLGVVAILAGAIVIGSVGSAIAYQSGPPSTVAAFDYSYLVFSLLWGILFFTEFPDVTALIGIVVICFAGFLAIPRSNAAQ